MMFFSKPAGHRFVDRGDPAAWDFTVGDFTQDAEWHDLDLSAIVPKGAIGVFIHCVTDTADANQQIVFKKKGNVNGVNVVWIYSQAYNLKDSHDCFVFCNADRVIEYKSNLNWTKLDFAVRGWSI